MEGAVPCSQDNGGATWWVAPTGQVPRMREVSPSVWLRGYRDHGGRSEWEAHFLAVVIPCEGEEFAWDWHWGDSVYISILQFDAGTWSTAVHHTGHTNPEDLYHVGANTAYWSNVVPPDSEGGWVDCWKARVPNG